MMCGSRPSARATAALIRPQEQRVGPIGTRFELGVSLGAHEEGVARQLHELNEPSVG